MEEKITVRMTDTYLFDFTLYHTYSKLDRFSDKYSGSSDCFYGNHHAGYGKDKTRADYFLSGGSGCVYCVYTIASEIPF